MYILTHPQRMYIWWSLCWWCTSGGVYVEDVPLVEFMPRMYLWWSLCRGCTYGGVYVEDVPLAEFMQRMYLCWSLCTLYLHACQVRVTVGDSGLCCCNCVTSFGRWLIPPFFLFLFFFFFFSFFFHLLLYILSQIVHLGARNNKTIIAIPNWLSKITVTALNHSSRQTILSLWKRRGGEMKLGNRMLYA